jgi:hypothetical protein
MEKMYVIRDYNHEPEFETYISDDSTTPQGIFWKFWENKTPKDERYTPKIFKNLQDAKMYLKEVKRICANEWKENEWVHKLYGKRKYMWDIYEFKNEEIPTYE